jgi:hypothetical protein
MITEILAWLTVVGIPVLLFGAFLWWLYRITTRNTPKANYVYTAPPPGYVQSTTTTTTTADDPKPEAETISKPTYIDEESFLKDDDEEPVEVEAGERVYRIYRSIDRVSWVECDPALTERAACNYADYIKRSNPKEFVRCDDPNGVILFYE